MQQAFPAIKPFARRHLSLAHQQIYLEQAGTESGIPLLFLHDGPGLGCHSADRCMFDPQHFHMLLPDQRGCGRSTPHLMVEGNHREGLCEDLVQMQDALDIKHWVIAGVGWGAQLALWFAHQQPQRVRGLLLMSTSLGRRAELSWLFEQGAPQVFPDAFQQFVESLKPLALTAEAILSKMTEVLARGNEIERMALARQWGNWMWRCAGVKPQQDLQQEYLEPAVMLTHATLAAHYMARQWGYKQAEGILPTLSLPEGLPMIAVHGRFDMVTPLSGVLALQRHLPQLQLNIVREAGHSVREASMVDAIVKAQARLADICGATPPACG